jgi:hypothetical protein
MKILLITIILLAVPAYFVVSAQGEYTDADEFGFTVTDESLTLSYGWDDRVVGTTTMSASVECNGTNCPLEYLEY